MASEVLKLTAQIVISHASMSELTPEQLVDEIKEVYKHIIWGYCKNYTTALSCRHGFNNLSKSVLYLSPNWTEMVWKISCPGPGEVPVT